MEENLVINNVKSMNHFKLHNIITKDNKAGNIIKFIDIKSKFFDKFGEIYFSEVNYKMICQFHNWWSLIFSKMFHKQYVLR